MRPSVFLSLCSLILLALLAGCAEMTGGELAGNVLRALSTNGAGSDMDEATIAAGLKEALTVGSERAVAATSQPDGFWGNQLIRIAMPPELTTMATTLRTIGFASQVDAMELAMNRAAEKATAEAKPVLLNAVSRMTLSDALGILRGGDTAATDYFRAQTSDELQARFLPIIQTKMGEVGLYQQYKQLMTTYNALPLTPKSNFNLDEYVAEQGLNGLFTMLASEEKEIRANPAARTTDLLKRVFAR